jgi:hypothetical protein
MIEIVPARMTHIGPIATRIREIDELECRMWGRSPKQSLRLGLQASTLAWTALIDGRPEAMFGASTISLIDGSGRPWMLMTEEAVRHRRALLRLGRLYTAALHEHYILLHNWVHAENNLALRWLARLGYGIGGVEVIHGQPMRPFVRCASPLRSD